MSNSNSKLWDVPDITEKPRPEDERKNALNMPLRWAYEPPEAEEEIEEVAPLTAEALEAIREAARLEGYEEGKLEGIAAGHTEGFEAGYADGEKLGYAAGEKTALEATEQLNESLSAHWQALFEGLRHPLKQVDQAVENQLVHLSMALARAICWQEVTQNNEVVREAFRRGIQELSMTSQRVEIYIHPEDFALIDGRWDEKTRADKGWFFYQDETISRGGCRIQTPLVAVDATLEARMNDVFTQLLHGVKDVPADLKAAAPPIRNNDPTTPEPKTESTVEPAAVPNPVAEQAAPLGSGEDDEGQHDPSQSD
ncbi:flagellar assembly protein FliH [Aliidiomarina quisquiliarum]|uniref:flagellar assembly protein FliH n=1 Tax=Aliidiomarina quisquiliarum TaxID=2938947 RepID=UPI00208E3EBF|nr:flagellar assembly protein FliH [Aliidiomarina quisquiliarum]MCO4322091.1 flagellar assembly protein FliH [Aliidiomarina quisquiliarum]